MGFMKNMQTQLDEYLKVKETGKISAQERMVMDAFNLGFPTGASRQDIHAYFQAQGSLIKECSVVARINELLWKEQLVIVDRKVTKNQQILAPARLFPEYLQSTKDYLNETRKRKLFKLQSQGVLQNE